MAQDFIVQIADLNIFPPPFYLVEHKSQGWGPQYLVLVKRYSSNQILYYFSHPLRSYWRNCNNKYKAECFTIFLLTCRQTAHFVGLIMDILWLEHSNHSLDMFLKRREKTNEPDLTFLAICLIFLLLKVIQIPNKL